MTEEEKELQITEPQSPAEEIVDSLPQDEPAQQMPDAVPTVESVV